MAAPFARNVFLSIVIHVCGFIHKSDEGMEEVAAVMDEGGGGKERLLFPAKPPLPGCLSR